MIKKMATKELQEIKRRARLKAAGLIRAALELGQCAESLVADDGMTLSDAELVEKELEALARRLES
jgi:hypothetical protein